MKILVTGGAGYIGSFMVRRLLDDGYDVVVADSLERGYRDIVDERATLSVGNVCDKKFTESLFNDHAFDAVIHFAGFIAVGESMRDPGAHFENNTFGTLNILEAMRGKTEKIIFSSTAAVYGNPIKIPIPEDHSKDPTSPYGESKYMVEKLLYWYNKAYGLQSVALRYFNAAGGSLDGTFGENHKPETHIIPNAIKAALSNSTFTLFGDDYPTDDGTCVRDYIHILDLIEAHMLALSKLNQDNGVYVYNVGTGKGFSNKEVLEVIRQISQVNFPIIVEERRAGDAEKLIADPTKIKEELGFYPQFSDLETIVKTAYAWHRSQI